MAAFSAKSFLDTGGEKAVILYSNSNEKSIINDIDDRISTRFSKIRCRNHPKESFRHFCLNKNFFLIKDLKNDFIILSDCHVIWHCVDKNKFNTFCFDLWFQKVNFHSSRWTYSRISFLGKAYSESKILKKASLAADYRTPLDVNLDSGLFGGSYLTIKALICEFCTLLKTMDSEHLKAPDLLLSVVIPKLNMSVASDLRDLNVIHKEKKKTQLVGVTSSKFQSNLNKLYSKKIITKRIFFINDPFCSGKEMATRNLNR